jgi:thiol-disulfide isomerase/thioredoxin
MNSIVPPNTPQIVGNYVTKTLEYITPHITWTFVFLMTFGGLILLVAVYHIYKKYGIDINILEKFTGNSENDISVASSNKNAELILFAVDWCPHCKTAKPEWENLKASQDGNQINGYTVVFTEYNCTKESDQINQLVSKYKIEGYPTIKLLKDGQIIDFDAKPTEGTLNEFLNTVL